MITVPMAPDRTRVQDVAGAVFDCDGILVDSEQPWLDLMEGYLRELGIMEFSGETMRGMTADEAVTTLHELVRHHGGDTAWSAGSASARNASLPTASDVDRAYSAALEGLATPMPGAPELVRALSGTVPLAVASNGRREDVHGLLRRAGLLDLFDVVVTIEDVDRGKPAPDPYLRAMQRLGNPPGTTIAFEDSVLGSQAAHDAGCTVVGVNQDLALPLVADVRLRSLDESGFDHERRALEVRRPTSTRRHQ
jgi:HAD superfamily hydrolase (TIGR01509 family)